MINISSVSYLDGDALRDCNTVWCWHQERDSFLYYSRLSLLLPRNCRCNPSSSSFAYTLLLLPLLTPHFDNVAFNQLSLGILVHFDGQSDGAGGTISSLCQLHVIHPFNFPRCTSYGGQLYWNGWDLLWAMKCGSSLIHAVESHSLVHMCVGFWTPTVSQPQDMRWQSYNGISYFKKINRT